MLTHWLLAHLVKAITRVRSPEILFSTFAPFKPPKPLFQVAVSKKSAEIPETQLFSIGSSNRLDRKSVLWKETDPELARQVQWENFGEKRKKVPKQPYSAQTASLPMGSNRGHRLIGAQFNPLFCTVFYLPSPPRRASLCTHYVPVALRR